jgi:hypothetical protein
MRIRRRGSAKEFAREPGAKLTTFHIHLQNGAESDIVADRVTKRDGHLIFFDELGGEVRREPVGNVISYERG